jgi:choice-of-anchor C domain-containing protein
MKKMLAAIACIAALVSVSGKAQANLITNGGFEGGTTGNSFVSLDASAEQGNTSIPGWTVRGSVDWINQYWQPSQGEHSLDLAGLYKHGLIVSDPFYTQGGTYRVSFDMAGNPDLADAKSLIVYFISGTKGGDHQFFFDQTGHTKDNMGWQSLSYDFVAADGYSQVAFMDVTNMADITKDDDFTQAWGAALDNVSVDLAPVPEPSTVFLLGAGLAGAVMYRRRERRNQR